MVHTGFVPDDTLAALYRGATCVVLPSIIEGFGLPALEAMACGAPVLAARTPALEEVCADAVDYFDRIDELPSCLAQLMNDREPPRESAPRRTDPGPALQLG